MFKDKVAVVTGAASGIGRALAIQFAEAGARVAASDINRTGLDETMQIIRSKSTTKALEADGQGIRRRRDVDGRRPGTCG